MFTVLEHDGLAFLFNIRLRFVKREASLPEDAREVDRERIKEAFNTIRNSWTNMLDEEVGRRENLYDHAVNGIGALPSNVPAALMYRREWQCLLTYTTSMKEDTRFDRDDYLGVVRFGLTLSHYSSAS